MKHRLRAALAAATITAASLVAAPAADAAGYYALGTMYADYGQGGTTQGMFVTAPCDALGWTFQLSKVTANYWGTHLSEISVTGNGGCDGIRVYERTNSSVYWTCLSCKGTVIRLAPPFNDDVSKVRYFHITSIVI